MYKEKIITLVGEALKEAKEEMVSRVKNITTDISFTLCKMSETECAIVAQVDKLCVVDKAYSKYFALDDVSSMNEFLNSVLCA